MFGTMFGSLRRLLSPDAPIVGYAFDAALQILKAGLALAGTYTTALTSDTFDLGFGQTFVNASYAPGAGGAALMMNIPIVSYAAPNTLTITATGGSYTLNVNGSTGVQTTAAIPYGSTAATIATALNALANVQAAGTSTVTGAGPFTVTLPPSLQVGGNQVNPLTVNTANLTGGSATVTLPTYTFVANESSDGLTWRPCSPARTVAQDNIAPTGDAYIKLMVQNQQRYLQLVATPAGTGASLVIGNVYLQPFVNKFGG